MSYDIYDSKGDGGQFATDQGIRDLEKLDLPRLKTFLANGCADDVNPIVNEVAGHPVAGYIADLLKDLSPPVIITDGIS